jgi:hypothetical protein
MTGVGLLDDGVSAGSCQCFVGSDSFGKDALNFCFISFDRRCMSTTGSYLAGTVVGFLQFSVPCLFTCFSSFPVMVFSPLMCWCVWSTEEVGEFRVIILLSQGFRGVLRILFLGFSSVVFSGSSVALRLFP